MGRGKAAVISLGRDWYNAKRPAVRGGKVVLEVKKVHPPVTSCKWYTPKQVAGIFNRKPETILDWIKAEKLMARRINGRYQVSDFALEAFTSDAKCG